MRFTEDRIADLECPAGKRDKLFFEERQGHPKRTWCPSDGEGQKGLARF